MRSKLLLVMEEEKQLRKQLDALDYYERLAAAAEYVGKYFMEANRFPDENIRCVYVYGTDPRSCETKSIQISYWKDQNDYFEIQYSSLFDPKKWEEEDKWEMITKSEFECHYYEVMKRINSAIIG